VSTVSANAAPSGSGTVTVSGLSFGVVGRTATASLTVADVCGSSAWTSATTVACAPQAYGGTAVRTTVSVSAVAGTVRVHFSFDGALCPQPYSSKNSLEHCRDVLRLHLVDTSAPLVSSNSVDNANLPSSGGCTVTVSGLNFGGYNCSATASMATSENCLSTTWTSVTTAVCATQSHSGGVLRSSVIARGVTSTGLLPFSFDGTQLEHNLMPTRLAFLALYTCGLPRFAAPVASAGNVVNTAISAGSIVTITGINLGLSCSTLTASWMSDACSSTAWTSATALSCTSQAYRGSALRAGVLLRGLAGTTMNTRFSFDGTCLSSREEPMVRTSHLFRMLVQHQ
jgi:hypothetical protein